ncbi:MAG: purine-nucleoside phosphorylase [Actinomycetota bacterium]
MDASCLLNNKNVEKTASYLGQFLRADVDAAIILGSFLNKTADFLPFRQKMEISMESIPGYSLPTVSGHKKALFSGVLGGKNLMVFGGRCHYYEGYSMGQVVLPVVLAKKFNAKHIIITNSAGGLSQELEEDVLMLIKDHINMMFDNPLFGYTFSQKYDYFLDMGQPYSKKIMDLARTTARKANIPLKAGVYAGIKGPVLETRTEAAMLKKMGADAVGMSTVAEAIMANYLDMEVLGISHIRNRVFDSGDKKFKHSEGNKKETKAGKILSTLIEGIIKGL